MKLKVLDLFVNLSSEINFIALLLYDLEEFWAWLHRVIEEELFSAQLYPLSLRCLKYLNFMQLILLF